MKGSPSRTRVVAAGIEGRGRWETFLPNLNSVGGVKLDSKSWGHHRKSKAELAEGLLSE